MQKVVDFLRDNLACSPDEALRLVTAQPHIFSYSVEKNLFPKVRSSRDGL
jgi:hypothetical protein